jgi:UDP-galactose transporter B1
VLAKSSKMIPVMLMGSLLHGKRYSLLEYACCMAISGRPPGQAAFAKCLLVVAHSVGALKWQ